MTLDLASSDQNRETVRNLAGNNLAGRQGVPRFGFRPFATVRDLLPSLSDSASSPTAVFSSAFVRLPTVADFTGVMSLEMSLAAGVSSDPLVETRVKVPC